MDYSQSINLLVEKFVPAIKVWNTETGKKETDVVLHRSCLIFVWEACVRMWEAIVLVGWFEDRHYALFSITAHLSCQKYAYIPKVSDIDWNV